MPSDELKQETADIWARFQGATENDKENNINALIIPQWTLVLEDNHVFPVDVECFKAMVDYQVQ